jgi:hypothetical protein
MHTRSTIVFRITLCSVIIQTPGGFFSFWFFPQIFKIVF